VPDPAVDPVVQPLPVAEEPIVQPVVPPLPVVELVVEPVVEQEDKVDEGDQSKPEQEQEVEPQKQKMQRAIRYAVCPLCS
jgi:hypothetical protein